MRRMAWLLVLCASACGPPLQEDGRVRVDLAEVIERWRGPADDDGTARQGLVELGRSGFELEIFGPSLPPSRCRIFPQQPLAEVACDAGATITGEATGPTSFAVTVLDGADRELALFGLINGVPREPTGTESIPVFAHTIVDIPSSTRGGAIPMETNRLDAGLVRVVALDPAGNPLEGATVRVYPAAFASDDPLAPSLFFDLIDAGDGVFEAHGVPVSPMTERFQGIPDGFDGLPRRAPFEVVVGFPGTDRLARNQLELENPGPGAPMLGTRLTVVPPMGFSGRYRGVGLVLDFEGAGGMQLSGFATSEDGTLDRAPLSGLQVGGQGESFSARADGRGLTGTFSDDWLRLDVSLDPGPQRFSLELERDDRTPPRVLITEPSDGAVLGPGDLTQGRVLVEGTTDDSSAPVVVNQVRATMATTPNDAGLITWEAEVALSPGTNRILATATDPAGNIGEDTIQLTFDTSGPGAGSISVAEGEHVAAREITLRLESMDAASVIVDEVASEGDCPEGAPMAFAPDAQGVMSLPFTLSDQEGEHVVAVIFLDPAGNESDCLSTTVTLDRLAPEIIFESPAPGALGCERDEDAISSGMQLTVRLRIGGLPDDSRVDLRLEPEVENGAATVPVNGGMAEALLTLPQRGDWNIVASATDRAGNEGMRALAVQNVCNGVPVVDALMDRETVIGLLTTLRGSASDPDGDAVTLTWRVAMAPEGSTAMMSNLAPEGPADAPTQNGTMEPDVVGTYTIELLAEDSEGGIGTGELTLSTPPFIANVEPGQAQSGARIVLTVRNYNHANAEDNRFSFFSAAARIPATVTNVTPPGPGDALVTVEVPEEAESGPIFVRNAGGEGRSLNDFTRLP